MSQPMVNFNVKAFTIAAEELVRADEVERALYLLNNLPAYYRDHEPVQVTSLRNEIMTRIATPNFYKNCDSSPEIPSMDGIRQTLRCRLVRADVETLNSKGLVPHIVDYAPGEYWLPIVLKEDGFDFTYQPVYLSDQAYNKMKPLIKEHMQEGGAVAEQPSIFVGLEIIEHLHNELELKTEMLKANGLCDIVHVSTPKYSYDYTCVNWRERETLGHLRAYAPKEFFDTCGRIFNEYDHFTFYDSQILHVRCMLKSTKLEKYNITLKD